MQSTTTDVQQAIRQIHDKTGRWPTPAAIAAHLGYHIGHVQEALRDLRRAGLYVCRKRGKGRHARREWMPAGER